MAKENMEPQVKKALRKLKKAEHMSKLDPEQGHDDADKALRELLVSYGCEDVVEAWKAVEKWYA